MKKVLLGLVLVSGLSFGQVKKVATSKVNWWGYGVMKSEASSHNGTVTLKSGELTLKKNSVVGGKFVLDMNSINAADVSGEMQKKLNAHLKNGDFFEVEKFPTATFVITNVKKNNDKKFNSKITGKLTIKGKTNVVSFPANVVVKDGSISLQSELFTFDRQKFDVVYQSSMKDMVIKDEVGVKVELIAK